MQPKSLPPLSPFLLVLLPVLYGIAEMIKITPLKRWLIPFILWGVSIVLTISVLFTNRFLSKCFCRHISGHSYSYDDRSGNQFIKQATEKETAIKKQKTETKQTAITAENVS
jgi:hypothetical protein